MNDEIKIIPPGHDQQAGGIFVGVENGSRFISLWCGEIELRANLPGNYAELLSEQLTCDSSGFTHLFGGVSCQKVFLLNAEIINGSNHG